MTVYLSDKIKNNLIIVSILAVCLVYILSTGSKYLGIATDYKIWFADDNPELSDFLDIQAAYEKSDNVVFIITPKNKNVFTKETIKSISELTDKAWTIPYSTRVESITNFQHTSASGDDLLVRDLVENIHAISDEELNRIKYIARSEPLVVNRLLSDSAEVSAINVTITLPDGSLDGNPSVAAYARKIAKEIENSNSELDIRITGLIMLDNALMEAAQADMQSLSPIMFGVIYIVLFLLLRSVIGTASIILLVYLSVEASIGFAGWLGVLLTPPSAGAPTIIMTVAIANAVHIYLSFEHFYSKSESKDIAIQECIASNILPISIAAMCTILGFMALHLAEVPPFHHLGNIVSMGVVVAYVLSFTLMPLLLKYLPVRKKAHCIYIEKTIDFIAESVVKNANKIFWSSMLLIVVVSAFAVNNVVNDRIWEYFDKSIQFRLDTDYAAEHLTGPYYLEYSYESGVENGVYSPEFMQQVDQFGQWLKEQPEVVHVNSFAHILKRLNMNLHSGDSNEYRMPSTKELLAQYILLYEMSLPYGLGITNQINMDKSSTRITVSLKNLSNVEYFEFAERSKEWLANNQSKVNVKIGSPTYLFANIGVRAVYQILTGTAIGLILMSMLIFIMLGSMKYGALSLVTNLVPPMIAFGIWGLLFSEVGFALALGIGMTIGIIVDDTVHFLTKFKYAIESLKMDAEDAVRYAYKTVGKALIITTIVLALGFYTLTYSSFKINSDMGYITVYVMVMALLIDLIFLPSLLVRYNSIFSSHKNDDEHVIEAANAAS